jgi:hypothetical protein
MMPTKEQRFMLIDNGWVYSAFMERQCRVCHNWISRDDDGWFSPRGAAYHSHCVLQPTRMKKLLRRLEKGRQTGKEVGDDRTA